MSDLAQFVTQLQRFTEQLQGESAAVICELPEHAQAEAKRARYEALSGLGHLRGYLAGVLSAQASRRSPARPPELVRQMHPHLLQSRQPIAQAMEAGEVRQSFTAEDPQ